MRPTARSLVTIDLLNSTADIAEFAKAAAKFGMRMVLEPAPVEGFPDSWKVSLEHAEPVWIETEAAETVYLIALARGKSIKAVLEGIESYWREQHAEVDRPPTDAPGIGELHPEGDQD